jgi:hypothetical protein
MPNQIRRPVTLEDWEDKLIGKKVRRWDGQVFTVTEISEHLEEGTVVYHCSGDAWWDDCELVEVN